MKRHTSTITLAVCGLSLMLAASVCAQQDVKLSAAQPKITTVSAVRARIGPQVAAQEIVQLKLGTVVSAVARSSDVYEIGGKKDYWYLVNLPVGRTGWVFGGLLSDYDSARRKEIFRRIINERLKVERLSFDDGMDFYNFVSSALGEAKELDDRAELELLKLLALARSVAAIPSYDKREAPPYRDWYKAHEREINYSEPSGEWLVRSELFWSLERKYRGSPIAERIAWAAAQNPLPGECEGDEVCRFLYLNNTEGMYLNLYPNGTHAREVLKNFEEALSSDGLASMLKDKGGDKYAAEQRADLRKALAELRVTTTKTSVPERATILKRLNQLTSGSH